MPFNLVVRGGTIVDGSGATRVRADVAVQDGIIRRIGDLGPIDAARVVDASGRIVAPGFVDIHTHFDAQLSWDPAARPTLEHGVTTVVTGNCSLSLAPLRISQRTRMSRIFGQIEQLPEALFDVGVDWSWETFAEWLAVRSRTLAINLAPLLGHSALRMFVMGDEAHHRAATDAEIAAMQRELADALAAGAAGLSLSYVDVDERGQPVPSRLAERNEIVGLAQVLGQAGGVLQIVPEYWDTALMCQRIDELAELSLDHGITTTLAPLLDQTPGLVHAVLAQLDRASGRGASVLAQVQPRGIDVNFRLDEWNFVLYRCSGWSSVLRLTDRSEQLAIYGDAATRERLVATAYPDDDPARRAQLDTAYVSAVQAPALASVVGRTLGDLALERGTNAAEAMLDIAVADDLHARFTKPPSSNIDIDCITTMLAHPSVLIGASDAGAHVRGFSTYGDSSYVLKRFVRDRHTFPLEDAVRRMTNVPATAWNLHGRGLLREGFAADIVVFDEATVDRGPEQDTADMPTGCARYVRGSVGIDATIVNGRVAWSEHDGYAASGSGVLASRRD